MNGITPSQWNSLVVAGHVHDVNQGFHEGFDTLIHLILPMISWAVFQLQFIAKNIYQAS